MTQLAPLIVTATFGADDHGWLEGLRRKHFPPERNQVPAHLTLFHHLPPSLDAELRDRLGALVRAPAPPAHITGIMDLGGGTAFRVESEALEDVRAELAAAFRGMLTPQDQAPWRPHITIQNKVPPKVSRELIRELERGFVPCPLGIAGLGLHRYLGGPWDTLAVYRFRGLS